MGGLLGSGNGYQYRFGCSFVGLDGLCRCVCCLCGCVLWEWFLFVSGRFGCRAGCRVCLASSTPTQRVGWGATAGSYPQVCPQVVVSFGVSVSAVLRSKRSGVRFGVLMPEGWFRVSAGHVGVSEGIVVWVSVRVCVGVVWFGHCG